MSIHQKKLVRRVSDWQFHRYIPVISLVEFFIWLHACMDKLHFLITLIRSSYKLIDWLIFALLSNLHSKFKNPPTHRTAPRLPDVLTPHIALQGWHAYRETVKKRQFFDNRMSYVLINETIMIQTKDFLIFLNWIMNQRRQKSWIWNNEIFYGLFWMSFVWLIFWLVLRHISNENFLWGSPEISSKLLWSKKIFFSTKINHWLIHNSVL